MKKLFILLIIFMLTIPVFAQKAEPVNRHVAVSFNPIPLFTGVFLGGFGVDAGLEFAPIRNTSLKAGFFYLGFDPGKFNITNLEKGEISAIRVNAEARWYPEGKYVEGFFLNGGFQYHRLKAAFTLENGEKSATTGGELNTYGLYFGLGYKAVFGDSRAGFTLEPFLDFDWPIKSDIPFDEMDPISGNLLGWALGVKLFRFGLGFGIAF
jgi:hypothetical protein